MAGTGSNGDRSTPLSARLRELRGTDMTQRQLADEFGVSTGLVSSWESGAVAPPADRLRQYAETFRPENDLELQSLLALRAATIPVVTREVTMMDVLKDIRWLLQEIRDRLPPRDGST